jgi:tetratricopeptide (TPR) repeat protein
MPSEGTPLQGGLTVEQTFELAATLQQEYMDAPSAEKVPLLAQAISLYELLLRVLTEREYPTVWALVQNNLGAAHNQLPTGDRGGNLKQAIGCYEAALRVYTERKFPAQWARTQNNLGAAYSQLPVGNRSGNLERAIDCYEAALRIYTEQEFPTDWATIQINLGFAYRDLPIGNRGRNLEREIDCYEAALGVYTERQFPAQWAMTQNNLGTAYSHLPMNRGGNLERAIGCYEAALRVRTEREFPADWAGTQNNLGNAYSQLPIGDRGRNLDRAIGCYEAALRVYTEQEFPADWATAQHNLGTTYSELATGDQGRDLERAIGCFEAALRVRTPEALPLECRRTLNNLGSALFHIQRWEQALTAYVRALEVTESVRAEALDESGRRWTLAESWQIFERGVVSAMRAERHVQALELAGRGKARNLADHLWQRDQKPRGVSDEDWEQYQRWLTDAREQEQAATTPRGTHRERWGVVRDGAVLAELERLRGQIRSAEARFAALDPDYVPFARPPAIEQIREIVRASVAVLVEFRVTSEGAYVFLLGPDDEGVTKEQVVELPRVTSQFVFGELANWLQAHYSADGGWQQHLEQTTAWLYNDILKPVHERLRERYPNARRLVLAPSQGLSLLPLHAA